MMGDCLRTGKPTRYNRTNHQSQLSLPSLRGVPACLAEIKAGCVYLCRVAGDLNHMAGDAP